MTGRAAEEEADLATRAVERVVTALPGAEVGVGVDRHRMALTRFANSVIHQNVAEDSTTVKLNVHHDGRTATASATVARDAGGDAGLDALVANVIAMARYAPLDPGWPGLAPRASLVARDAQGPLDEVDPATRAQVVRAFVDGAGGLETAGYCRTNLWSGAHATSSGTLLTDEAAECGFSGVARDRGADGVARHAPLRVDQIDGAALGARAAAKARAWRDPVELAPGRYEVVLEPAAVADILEALAGAGFNGKAVNEQRSFIRLGEQQFDPSITLIDDPVAVSARYDVEGTPRRRTTLIERGTTTSLTHDRRSAAEAGTTSTGHAVDIAFAYGPMARHLTLAGSGGDATGDRPAGEVPGPSADDSVAELVSRVRRGLLVSDFFYTRMLDPRSLAITGLTRNGLWLIEDGRVTQPVRNFRFTQSYAQALMPGNVLAVGRVATPLPGDTYSATSPRWTCPALWLGAWNFTGGASG